VSNQKPVSFRQLPTYPDVAAIRAKTCYDKYACLTQENFARAIGVSVEPFGNGSKGAVNRAVPPASSWLCWITTQTF
jgi:hypothetical protein